MTVVTSGKKIKKKCIAAVKCVACSEWVQTGHKAKECDVEMGFVCLTAVSVVVKLSSVLVITLKNCC